MRRMPPTQGAADAKAGDLCLIDFGEARLGTEQELAQERTALEYALDRRVRPRFGTDNQ